MMKYNLRDLGIGTLAVLACSGCSTWNKNTAAKPTDGSWSITKMWKKEYQQPQSIAAIWAPDVLSVPGKPQTRGFGGRIYFYNERSQAIPVDGEFIVHGYLGTTTKGQSEQIAADKTFGFTAEQLTGHFSPSEMGASYSVWIPWDAADGLRQEVTLIPTFKGKDGSIVQGSPAKVNLPGKVPDGMEEAGSVMKTVSYTRTATPTNPGPAVSQDSPKMRTMTINVPSNATIAQQRRVESFTLGATRHTNTPSLNTPGVSIGGGVVPTVNTSIQSLPPVKQTQNQNASPSQGDNLQKNSLPAMNLKPMTPPPMPDPRAFPPAVPMTSPAAPAWTQPNNAVRQAAYTP